MIVARGEGVCSIPLKTDLDVVSVLEGDACEADTVGAVWDWWRESVSDSTIECVRVAAGVDCVCESEGDAAGDCVAAPVRVREAAIDGEVVV